MKLEFLGHDERYIVEQSLMTLFPLEKPTYDAVQPEDEAWCRLAAEETAADCQVTAELHYHGYTAAGTFASPLTGPSSGWTYTVNGESPDKGCSQYVLDRKSTRLNSSHRT